MAVSTNRIESNLDLEGETLIVFASARLTSLLLLFQSLE